MSQLREKSIIIQHILLIVFLVIVSGLLWNIWQILLEADNQPLKTNNGVDFSYQYVVDPQGTFNESNVLNQRFEQTQGAKIPYQLDDSVYWVKLTVNNELNETRQLTLHADNPVLDTFIVFDLINNTPEFNASLGKLKQANQSEKTATNSREVHRAFPHFNFQLSANEQLTYLFKIKTYGPPNVPLVLYETEKFEQRVKLTQLIYGAFIGIVLMIVAYNLVLYFAVKDKVHLSYIAYLLCSFLVVASLTGFGYLIFPPSIQYLNEDLLIPLDAVMVAALALFTLYYLRYDETKDRLYKFGIGLISVMLAYSVISLALDPINQAFFFFSMQPIFYVFSILIISKRLRKDFIWARFYFISWIPFLAGAAIQPMLLMNKIDYSFLTRYAFLFSVLIEVTFMAFALAERVRRHEKDRLDEVLYHRINHLPRRLLIQDKISQFHQASNGDFSVLAIKPEQIDSINLYLREDSNAQLYKSLSEGLNSLFAFNDAIVSLNASGDKLCLLDNNTLLVIVDNKKKQQSTEVLVQSIQSVIYKLYQVENLHIPLSASVGVASYPTHGTAANTLVNRAQQALQQAQRTSKRWSVFEFEQSYKAEYLLKLASELRVAIDNGNFELYHQPQIDLKTARVCGSECLIRWQHPTEGNIPPTIFVEIAEDMGLINNLTQWVLKTALAQQSILAEAGYASHMVSINISGRDVSSERFFERVSTLINEHDIAPEKIIFELTESATIINDELATLTINKLSEMGLSISIDDFGTGYSSMAYISALPFNELKIDRQFVENVNQSHKRKTIAETTTKMAKGLGLEVVAEGINSDEDQRTMRTFGADIGQGYYYAKPMPLEQYLQWLAQEQQGTVPAQGGEFIAAKTD